MLDKAIEHGKEFRKPYKGGKAVAYSCRNHGACEWCRQNRAFKFRDKKYTVKEIEMEEIEYGYGGCSDRNREADGNNKPD